MRFTLALFFSNAAEERIALGIVDHLRRRFARFKLCAHLLDLRCLSLLLLERIVLISAGSCYCRLPCSSFLRCSLRNSLSNIAFTAS